MKLALLLASALMSSFYPLNLCSRASPIGQDGARPEEQRVGEPLEQENSEPVIVGLERLDADALTLLTTRLDLESYANLLRASPILLQKARLPDYQEHQKLAEAATTISTLDHHNDDQRNQLQSLLRGARMLYRLRSQVPMLLEADEGEPLREIADRFLVTYEECTGLAKLTLHNQERWALNCLEAFAVKNYLVRLWPFLPQEFQSDHLLDACVVAIRQRNLKAFGYFAKIAKAKSPQVLLQSVIPESVGQSGDIELYKAVIGFWPSYRIIKFRQMVVQGAAEAGQVELLQHLLHDDPFTVDPSNLKSKCLITACTHGHLGLIKHYQRDRCVRRLEPWCIFGAAKGGNLNILKHFLWDDDTDMPKGGSCLPYAEPVYQKALCEALRHNRMDVVRFLMQRSQDGQQCWPAVTPAAGENEALVIAFSQGNRLAIKLFLERDEAGAPRFPDFTLGGFGNRVLLEMVKVGRLDMIEFMVEAVDTHMDARYDDLDFAVNGNLPLEIAANHGHVEIVSYFLRKKAEGHPSFQAIDVAARHGAILHAACRTGHLEVVRLLMAFSYNEDGLRDRWANGGRRGGVAAAAAEGERADGPHPRPTGAAAPLLDPGVRRNRALRLAIKGGHMEIVKLFLQRVDGVRRYPNVVVRYSNLVEAAETGNSAVLQALIRSMPFEDLVGQDRPLPFGVIRMILFAIELVFGNILERAQLVSAAVRSRDYDTIKLACRCRDPAIAEHVTMDEMAGLVASSQEYEVVRVIFGPVVSELRGLPSSDWDRALAYRVYQQYGMRLVHEFLVATSLAALFGGRETFLPPLDAVLNAAIWVTDLHVLFFTLRVVFWALIWMCFRIF